MAAGDATRHGEPEQRLAAADEDELLQAQAELAAARAQVAALQTTLAERTGRLADASAALQERERTIAHLQAGLPHRLGRALRNTRGRLVEAIRRLGRRYVSVQTRNRLVRRYPWLRRKRAHPAGPLPSSIPTAEETAPGAAGDPTHALSAGYDLVYLPVIEWQARPQRPQHLAGQFAEHGSRVYYINPVNMLLAYAGRSYAISPLAQGVWDVRLPAPRRPLIYRETLDAATVRELAAGLDALRRDQGIAGAACLVGFPSWAPLALELRRRYGWKIVYDCMDDWQSAEGVQKPALDMEETLVRECDLLLAASQRLYDKWQGRNAHTLLLRNGFNGESFARAYAPNDELAGIAHPLIGYAGPIGPRLDFDLLRQLAASKPRWQFVLAGNVVNAGAAQLPDLPNVHIIDSQSPERIPAYVYHFDACIMPIRLGRAAPIDVSRFYEYMSAGKPVVATPQPELQQYESYLYPAADAAVFAAQLERALAETDAGQRRQRRMLAFNSTWSKSYHALRAAIDSTYGMASLVIVAYNNVALTQQCIESIYRNTAYPSFEVIVVDNASSDATRAYLSYAAGIYPRLRFVVNSSNEGFARACNRGAGMAGGGAIVFLNNDVVTPRGWLGRLLRHLDDPAIGLVGPVTNSAGNEARIETTYQNLDEMERFAAAYVDEHADQVFDILVAALFCTAVRRAVLEKVGPLDERFEIGMFEDDDFSRRVKQAGYRVVCAEDVFVHHAGEVAFKQMPPDEYQRVFEANRARFEEKWHTTWQRHTWRGVRA